MAFQSDALPTTARDSGESVAHSVQLRDSGSYSEVLVSPMSQQGVEVGRPAGVSSRRLTELRSASAQESRDRGHGPRGPPVRVNVALRDNVTGILRPGAAQRESSPGAAALDRTRSDDYAGMRSDGINELRTSLHGRSPAGKKKRGLMTNNESVFVSDVLLHHGRPLDDSSYYQDPRVTQYLQQQSKPKSRNLQKYFGRDELHKAFCTKFEIVDKATGRTEIMTARRPGSAAAIVSLNDFDSYVTRPQKSVIAQQQKSSIENTSLGLMPREGAEVPYKPYFTQTAASVCMKQSQLRCQDSWLAPGDDARTMRHLGQSKRHVVLPWTDRPTSKILQHQPSRPVKPPLVCEVNHARGAAM